MKNVVTPLPSARMETHRHWTSVRTASAGTHQIQPGVIPIPIVMTEKSAPQIFVALTTPAHTTKLQTVVSRTSTATTETCVQRIRAIPTRTHARVPWWTTVVSSQATAMTTMLVQPTCASHMRVVTWRSKRAVTRTPNVMMETVAPSMLVSPTHVCTHQPQAAAVQRMQTAPTRTHGPTTPV